jgi:CRP-like cAMP-binding protein
MSELELYIKSYFGIEEKDLNTIASLFKTETLKKGDYYLKTGMYCDKLSFIKSGLLRIYIQAEDKEITQWISSTGYFITDLSSLTFRQAARWNIHALIDTELYTIAANDYHNIGKMVPKWHELEKLFLAKCFSTLEDRIMSHLSMTAEERYHRFQKSNPELFQQVPLQYIASMLGMTPETFSRIRKKEISNN